MAGGSRARMALRRRGILATILLTLLLTALACPSAGAHASLIEATPAAGSTVPSAPTAVRLAFTEIVSVTSGGVAVTGPDGRPLATRADRDPDDARAIVITLPPRLPAGTYAVRWNVLSIDGHSVGGSYRFAIIRASSPLTTDQDTSGTGPGLVGVIGRALAAAGALALVGMAIFPWVVVAPARRRLTRRTGQEVTDAVVAAIDRRLPRWAALGAVPAVVGTLIVLTDAAAASTGLSLTGVLADPPAYLSTLFTRTGGLLVTRVLLFTLAGLALVLAGRVGRTGLSPRVHLGTAAALGLAGLLTFSLSSHAAAARVDRPVAIAFDAIHLLASAVWIGGLLGLALVALPVARQVGGRDTGVIGEIAAVASFAFSVVAQLAMVAVLTTGGYAALIQITRLDDLGQTSWGTALTAKVALWVTVLLIAAFNAAALIPQLADRSEGATRRMAAAGDLSSAIRLELVLAAGLVVAAALMSATAQPSQIPAEAGGGAATNAVPGWPRPGEDQR